LIDEKLSLGEIVFLVDSMQKRSCWIGAVSAEQLGVENQLCIEFYCKLNPRPLAVDFDSGLVNRDPRGLRPRRM
jgi:hypothetical protein